MKVSTLVLVGASVLAIKVAGVSNAPMQHTEHTPRLKPIITTVPHKPTTTPVEPVQSPTWQIPPGYGGMHPTMPGVIGWKEVLV